KDTLATVVESENKVQRPVYYKRRYNPRKTKDQNDSLNKPETIETKLWAKIEQDLISDNKKSLLQLCQIYKMNCDQHIFTECEYSEDVLFFMASLVSDDEKPILIMEYKDQYPSGKYIDRVDKLIIKPKITLNPINEGFAKLDYDKKILLANRIEGGNRPYHIGFFDYSKNKEYAVKSIGFNTDDISIDLSTLEIPDGPYTVKVRDSVGRVFVEKSGVLVSEDIRVPNSIKLISIIGLIGLLILLYKRFIHF
ncbi:MAG: hypothetical protein WBM98_16795, partial [Maribacter sp.]|uniref:hypothetical protein n=1 Tax=Maribacter sp. TaxID=1897614 RepID=UPI003C75C99D